jgi:hypothetical protein
MKESILVSHWMRTAQGEEWKTLILQQFWPIMCNQSGLSPRESSLVERCRDWQLDVKLWDINMEWPKGI